MGKEKKLDAVQVYDALEAWSGKTHHAITPEDYLIMGWDISTITKGVELNEHTWNVWLN